MHPIYPILTSLLFACAWYPSSTTATETGDNGPTATSPDAVSVDLPSRLRRRIGAQLPRHTRRATSDTCPTNYFQCGNGLPTDFCCPAGDSCISLANNTTVLCCPAGEDCSQIEPLTCNIAGQNATAYPTLLVHTTNLTGELLTCGSQCCPFGYACSTSDLCVRTDNNAPVTQTLSLAPTGTTTTAAGTGTVLVIASGTYTPSSATTTSNIDSTSDSSSLSSTSASSTDPRTIGIAAASAVAGVASIGAIIAFAWSRRRRAPEPTIQREVRVSVSQFPATPPPLPEKEPHQILKRKRKSLLSWVPSIINRTPAELPATPVSFDAWNRQWGQPQRPDGAHRPYPRDSLTIEEVYELDGRWLPQERYP